MNVYIWPFTEIQKYQASTNLEIDLGITFVDADEVTFGDQGDVEFYPKNATKYGAVWDTSHKSPPGNVAPGSSGYANYAETVANVGGGDYKQVITGLTSGMTYWVRVYAYHPDVGYVYSNEGIFETIMATMDDCYFTMKDKPGTFYFKTKDTDFVMNPRRK